MNVPDLWARRADLTPSRPAVWFEGRWITYQELEERARRLAAHFAAWGARKGERVSILAYNDLAYLDLLGAARKTGAIFTAFNFRWTATEAEAAARYVRPRILIFGPEQASQAEAIGRATPDVLLISRQEARRLASEGAPKELPDPGLTVEDPWMILFTGGTTGTLKGALIPYRQDLANAANTVLSWGLREDDCVIQATPMFHAAVSAFTLPLLHLGARVAIQRLFDPGDYLRLVEELGATILFLVPTMYKMVAEHESFPKADLSRVRWAISGGAPCPQNIRDAFRARGVRFKQGYGLTEAGVNCFAMELDDAEARPGSVGKPVLYAQAVLRDQAGRPVPRGEIGELTLAGPHVFSGYFEKPVETAEALRDGWLWTGDLARQDEEGFFTIMGRRKEMFISGGENVFPNEIEDCLNSHPAVSECCVTGVPDERWGEVGLAVVVLRAGQQASAEELREFLHQRLAGYKAPKYFHFAESLPKSGAGKILKRDAAAQFRNKSS